MSFELRTERLLLRTARMDDAQALSDRRSDPLVAEWQFWVAPFSLERATELLTSATKSDEPLSDEWFMITVADAEDREVLGDLALHLTWEGRCAEIGYSFDSAHWGQGYAVEATTELVRWLFEDQSVSRVHAQLHPANVASARVLERTGLLFEGHTRSSYWVGDESSDDWLYGMTRSDWRAWQDRPRQTPDTVRLVEITHDNVHAVRSVVTHKSQEHFVTPVEASLADALVPELFDGVPPLPWYRAIEADGELVGFVMLAQITDAHPEPYLWRLLIDRRHQRRGIGTRALDLVSDVARSWGAESISVSYVEGRGSPKPLYDRYGYVPTGELIDGETEARLILR